MTERRAENAPAEAGAKLLEAAFRIPQQQGREDWRQMTVAVLKNRLLDLTQRNFREDDWGVSTFGEFLQLFPALVEVDTSAKPPVARWVDASGGEPSPQTGQLEFNLGPRRRIRDDLWRAVLDFTSQDRYYWDADSASVVVAKGEELELPSLPTLTTEELVQWRKEFVDSTVAADSDLRVMLDHWVTSSVGAEALPKKLRSLWFGKLKGKVLDRLLDWFSIQGVNPPQNIVHDLPQQGDDSSETEALRETLLECVRVMTTSELEAVRLPVAVVARARR